LGKRLYTFDRALMLRHLPHVGLGHIRGGSHFQKTLIASAQRGSCGQHHRYAQSEQTRTYWYTLPFHVYSSSFTNKPVTELIYNGVLPGNCHWTLFGFNRHIQMLTGTVDQQHTMLIGTANPTPWLPTLPPEKIAVLIRTNRLSTFTSARTELSWLIATCSQWPTIQANRPTL
jgi:hypothetical protein